jgi:RHS repeat-associated protein
MVTTSAGPRPIKVTRTYDARGELASVEDPEGALVQFTHDPLGNPAGIVNALGKIYRTRYSPSGRLEEVQYPDGSSLKLDYGTDDQLSRLVDRGGKVYGFDYDAADRPTSLVFPDGTPAVGDNPELKAQYDVGGLLSGLMMPEGDLTLLQRNAAGRIERIVSPSAGAVEVEYDHRGRETSVTDALGRTTGFEYDAQGRRVRISLPDGASVQMAYDEVGNLIRRTDQDGFETRFEYDAVNRLTAVIDALGGRTDYGYDELGRRIRQTDANGWTTRFEYDGNGRQTAIIRPLGQRAELRYDAAGNLVETEDFNGDITRFTYSDINQLTETQFPDGSKRSFTYTAGGQLESVADARGTTWFEYDGGGRPLRRTEPDGTIMEYTWNDNGQVASIAVPSGTLAYDYDSPNRMTRIIDFDGDPTDMDYDAVGNLTLVSYPNGATVARSYDAMDRVELVELRNSTGTLLAAYTYTYDGRGNRTRVTEANGRQVTYRYDALSRLIEETISEPGEPVRSIAYTYDAVGNRLSREDSVDGVTVYEYDLNDRLLTESLGAAVALYGYDANGNTLLRSEASAVVTYGWDTENRLTQVTAAGSQTDLGYDHAGLLTSIASPSGETRLLNDASRPFAEVIEAYASEGSERTPYTIGNQRIAFGRGGEKRFYFQDEHSGVRLLLDGAGAPTDTFTYDAFGQVLDRTGSSSDPYRYREERGGFDGVDAYYLRARYLDPRTGRFLSTDPFEGLIDKPVSLHRYLYANANPATMVDPGGMLTLTEVAVRLAIYGGLAVTVQQGIRGAIRAADDTGIKWEGKLGMGSIGTDFLASLAKAQLVIPTVSIGGSLYRAQSSCGGDDEPYNWSTYQPKAVWASFFGGFEVFGLNPAPVGGSVGDFDMWAPSLFGTSTMGLTGGMAFAGYTGGAGPIGLPDIPGLPEGATKAGAAWVSGFAGGVSFGFDYAFDLSAGVLAGFTLPVGWEDIEDCPPGG